MTIVRDLLVKITSGGEPVPRWLDPNTGDKMQLVPQFEVPLIVVPASIADSQITVVAAAPVAIPAAPIAAGAIYALLELKAGVAGTDGIRWWDDGKVPTTGAGGNGHELTSPTYFWIRQALAGWQLIALTATSVKAVFSYYKPAS